MKYKIIIILFVQFSLFSSCQETNKQLLDRGVSLADRGSYKEAIEKYTKIISNNNNIQLAYYNRGLCYIQTKDYEKALNDFNTILKLKTIGGGNIVFTLNEQNSGLIEEADYQVSYDDGIYGRAQVRFYLDSLKTSYEDFQLLIDKNYAEKVFCILFQADIWHETGDDSTACKFVQRARAIAKEQDEISDCEKSLKSYCEKDGDR